MKTFALQNPDYTQFFWCEEMGWSSIEDADIFFSNELEEDYCLKLRKIGTWKEVKVKAEVTSNV
jgi:hypothetical protein